MARKLRKLTAKDVVFTIEALEEDIPVRGNALASGDEAADKECEDEIIARLNRGDVWAWCAVKVTATYKGWSASEHLGCCSYDNEEDFKKGGYFEDMCREALHNLNAAIAIAASNLPLGPNMRAKVSHV